ncbi:hypothetical protein Agabi119p4_9768 [Agaricus bisporus var. burnettii]|uniref:Uncharacterized protein n=1 Tax=Agaricus bisporus var. burnettii TaxID=192524 RepID=A0A8H7C3N0_AGABI|nr:hypothetical protein Agabi119p4_9768 [Agaricus bisporus var. burnettii]
MSSVSRPVANSAAPVHSVDPYNSVAASAYARTLLAASNANPAALREALRSCQVALDEKTEEVKALQTELSNLKASLMAEANRGAKSGRSKRSRGAGDLKGTLLEGVSKNINKDVRALAAMHFLWLGDGSFQQAPVLSNPFPIVSERYSSDENLDHYHTYILYAELSYAYHDLLQDSSLLKEEVQYLLLSERSTLVRNVRNAALDIFFGCPPIVAQSVYLREQTRAREPECLRFLVPSSQVPSSSIGAGDPKPQLKYLELPPILFPDLDTSRVHEIFRSDILIQKAPGRAVALQQGQIERVAVPPTCLACQRSITKTTPGLIAVAAILASFVISGDPTFSEKGQETGAAYKARYFKYKLLIEESQEAGELHMVATFDYWNQRLFGGNQGNGETFNFDEDDDEMASYRRAILQTQEPSASAPSSRPARASPALPVAPIGSSVHRLVRSDTTAITLSVPLPATLGTPQATPPFPESRARVSDRPSIAAGSSPALISAPQPGSVHFIGENIDEGGDTDTTASDSNTTPPVSAISRAPNRAAVAAPPCDNDRELVQQFHSHLNLIDEQLRSDSGAPIVPDAGLEDGISHFNRAVEPSVAPVAPPRRGRPAGVRMPRSTQEGPGPRLSTRQTAEAAPTNVRSRLRNRAGRS